MAARNSRDGRQRGADASKALLRQENLHSARLYTILYHMYVAFKSYFVLEAYSRSLGKEIINVTPGSYIDAFKRMKI